MSAADQTHRAHCATEDDGSPRPGAQDARVADPTHAQLATALDEALALLAEASAYLKRLPQAPVTTGLIRKMDAHQQSPALRSALQAADDARTRTAGIYTPSGVTVIEAEVLGDDLRIKIGPPIMRERAIRTLQAGCVLTLQHRTPTPSLPRK